MKTKKLRTLFLCLTYCLLGVITKAQSVSSEETIETKSSIPGSGYDCLGVWRMISPSPHEVINGVFKCRIDLPPESKGTPQYSYLYGPSIVYRNFSSNYIDLHLDINELIPESKVTGGLVTYELVVPKWVDIWGRPASSGSGIICHYHIEVRLNGLY
nr:hypothetical protein [Parabacteroides goldsteinii]